MSPLPEVRSETAFEDFKPAYSPHQALLEANRCLYCHDAPCVHACPTSIDIPEFIRKIATGNVEGSAKTIFDANIFGMSCARVCPVEVLCVGSCVYNEMGMPPIQIGRLQRFATDRAFAEGWSFHRAGPDTGRSVGLIGGGPASLACAHALRRYGHACTLYEKREVLGGLNTTGVAPYKMRADRSVEEVEWILSIGGIEVRTGVSVPDDVSWAELEARHDALFIGFGLGPDSWLGRLGRNLVGVHGAVETIERLKLGTIDLAWARQVVVLGGGNTAIDCVRELIGLGVEKVTMVYRGTEAMMAGYAHEWDAAKRAGALAVWKTQPFGFRDHSGHVTAVRCFSTDHRKRPIPRTEHDIPADLVLLAFGQATLAEVVADLEGVEIAGGCIRTDDHRATGRRGVFAGGDCCNGGKEVVNATAHGRDAADAIHAFLTGGGA